MSKEAINAIKRYQELYNTGDVGRMMSPESKEYHNSKIKESFSDWILNKIIAILESEPAQVDNIEDIEQLQAENEDLKAILLRIDCFCRANDIDIEQAMKVEDKNNG